MTTDTSGVEGPAAINAPNGSAIRAQHAMHHDSEAASMALAEIAIERRIEKEIRKEHRSEVYVVGRLLLASLFVVSGAAKFASFAATERAMTAFGLTDAGMLLGVGIGVEILGGAMLAVGLKARFVAGTLIGYLATVTLLVHSDFSIDQNRAFALANLAFCGGLLMIVAHGSGVFSLDRALQHRAARRYQD